MIKIDNAPDPKKKAAEAKPAVKKEKVNIYKFSEDVLHELSDDNVPSTPISFLNSSDCPSSIFSK